MKKKWKMCLLRHLKNRHGVNVVKAPLRMRSKTRPFKPTRWSQIGGKTRTTANLTAVGWKQFAIVRTLFNADRMLRNCSDKYLENSARILRESAVSYAGRPDKATVEFITRTNVSFVPAAASDTLTTLKIGSVRVSGGFAELYFSEYLLNDHRIEKTRHRLVIHYLRCGCSCAELLPSSKSVFWVDLMERLLFSEALQKRKQALLLECADHGEFSTVSMDGLLRPTRNISGQVDYRASFAKRNAAPIPDSLSMRRIMSVRGRTGAVLMLEPTCDESGVAVGAVLAKNVPEMCLQQVRSMACDMPSQRLLEDFDTARLP